MDTVVLEQITMDEQKLRAWWSFRQGLDGSLQGKNPTQVLDRSGWARSVGSMNPYLTVFSRAAGSQKDVDEAQRKFQIHELPAAGGDAATFNIQT
jgi:hypothetical protein